MTTYAVPHPTDHQVRANFDDSMLSFKSNEIDISIMSVDDELVLRVQDRDVPAQHDIVRLVSAFTGLDENVAASLIKRFLELNYGVAYSTAIEDWFEKVHPLLKELKAKYPALVRPTSLPRRLEIAFRQSTLKRAASEYWDEVTCGSSAMRAFAESIVVNDELNECKVSWMGLVPSTLRHELSESTPKGGVSAFPVTPECRSMFTDLNPRTSVEVVKEMMTDSSMALTAIAGHQLGYKMSGRDPIRIVSDLKEFVRTNGFGRCRDLGEYLTKRGLAGVKVTEIRSRNDLVIAGNVLKNCLNNPSQPYRHGVLSGRYRIFCLGDAWDGGAIAFDARNWKLIEAKGINNLSLPKFIHDELDAAIKEWGDANA